MIQIQGENVLTHFYLFILEARAHYIGQGALDPPALVSLGTGLGICHHIWVVQTNVKLRVDNLMLLLLKCHCSFLREVWLCGWL